MVLFVSITGIDPGIPVPHGPAPAVPGYRGGGGGNTNIELDLGLFSSYSYQVSNLG